MYLWLTESLSYFNLYVFMINSIIVLFYLERDKNPFSYLSLPNKSPSHRKYPFLGRKQGYLCPFFVSTKTSNSKELRISFNSYHWNPSFNALTVKSVEEAW